MITLPSDVCVDRIVLPLSTPALAAINLHHSTSLVMLHKAQSDGLRGPPTELVRQTTAQAWLMVLAADNSVPALLRNQ